MPVARAPAPARRSIVPEYAILAAVLAILALSGGMMLGIVPIPF